MAGWHVWSGPQGLGMDICLQDIFSNPNFFSSPGPKNPPWIVELGLHSVVISKPGCMGEPLGGSFRICAVFLCGFKEAKCMGLGVLLF